MATPNIDFPAKAIASLLGITTRRLQQLAQEGHIPKTDRGMYPLIGSVQGYIKYLKHAGTTTTGTSQHQRLARANATKVEMENMRRAGELVMRDQAHEILSELFAGITVALEGIPGRTANEYAGISDAAVIRARQQDELRRVRTQIADSLEQFAESLEYLSDIGTGDAATDAEDTGELGGSEPDTASD